MGLKKLSLFLFVLSLSVFSTPVSAAELWSNQLWTEPWTTQPAGDISTEQDSYTWCNSPLWSTNCGSANESMNSEGTDWWGDWWSTETPTVTEYPKGSIPSTGLWSESFWSGQPVIEKPQDKSDARNEVPKPISPNPESEPIQDPKPVTPTPGTPQPEQETIVITMQIGNNKAIVRGLEKELSVPPTIINGRTMVPLRFIGEAFEATLNWFPSERKITAELEGMALQLWINKSTALVNGQEVLLDTPPVVLNGSALVPLKFISDHLGYKIKFDSITQTITISETKTSVASPSTGNSQTEVFDPEPIKLNPIKPEPPQPTPPPSLNYDYFGTWNLLTDWYTGGIPMGFLVVNENGSYYLTNGNKQEVSGSWRVAEKDEVIGIKEALILESALDGVDWALVPKQAGLSVRFQHGYAGGAKLWFEYSLGVKMNE